MLVVLSIQFLSFRLVEPMPIGEDIKRQRNASLEQAEVVVIEISEQT
jgi:hypothetical protein